MIRQGAFLTYDYWLLRFHRQVPCYHHQLTIRELIPHFANLLKLYFVINFFWICIRLFFLKKVNNEAFWKKKSNMYLICYLQTVKDFRFWSIPAQEKFWLNTSWLIEDLEFSPCVYRTDRIHHQLFLSHREFDHIFDRPVCLFNKCLKYYKFEISWRNNYYYYYKIIKNNF